MRRDLTLNLCRGMIVLSIISFGISFDALAQQKKPITPADYGKWETLTFGELSSDGKWLAYGVNRSNGKNEMRVRSLSGDQVTTIAFGSSPAFSGDGRWLAYTIGYSEQEQERMTKAKKPIQNKLGLLNLTTRETIVIDGVASFAFNKSGEYLAMRRYPVEKKEGQSPAEGESGVDREAPGVDLVVRDLVKGADTNFGNVSGFAWQDAGALLAMTINAEGKAGNGVQLYDAMTGALRALDSGAATFTGLVWRKDDDDLIALRSKKQDGYEEETFVALVWRNLAKAGEKKIYDPTADASFPKDTRIVKYRAPVWSEDGETIFLGVKAWKKKPGANSANNAEAKNKGEGEDDEPAGVEVWHARDVSVIPEQKLRADRDRQKNFLAAWNIDSGRFVKLGDESIEEVTPVKNSKLALGRANKPYENDEMFGRPATDVYVIDTATGERKQVIEKLTYLLGSSPGGRYVLYFKDDHFWTYDLKSGAQSNISKSAATSSSFANREDDHPVAQKPPYGVAGWTKNDASVIVYDQYDLWELRPDGSKATRLTDGAKEEVRHRYARLDPKEESIDPSKPLYLSLYGRWTKRSGYARVESGKAAERLLWLDKNVGRLIRARDADIFAYVAQAFDDSPDYFVAGPRLADARQVTETNPFQKDYAWGRAELIEYQNPRGERLQGVLSYPADYEPGRQYPMIVYIYELLSQNLHMYSAPSERSPYNPAVFTSRGYFVLQPDIVFRPRDPGLSIKECVTAAVNKALERGMIDRARVGIVGHSWGGYGTAFLATNTDLFAAAVAGAALTDLVSMYGSVFWNSGRPETDHFEVGQERMQAPLWEDRDAYLRNSPIHNVHRMKTPLLMAFGDKDGSVDWHQGLEMYNVARRAGKDFVLLVYPGENHSNRKRANQIDYHRRIIEWFGHYLQGAPAADWMKNGVKHLDREEELKRMKERTPSRPPQPVAGASSAQK
jgi:dipeptidyl aminopeptidase/acylaminoacyl peptidase